jgi:hypothetical protein
MRHKTTTTKTENPHPDQTTMLKRLLNYLFPDTSPVTTGSLWLARSPRRGRWSCGDIVIVRISVDGFLCGETPPHTSLWPENIPPIAGSYNGSKRDLIRHFRLTTKEESLRLGFLLPSTDPTSASKIPTRPGRNQVLLCHCLEKV